MFFRSKEDANRFLSIFVDSMGSILEGKGFANTARAIFDACKTMIGAVSGYAALLDSEGKELQVLFLDSGGIGCYDDLTLRMPTRGAYKEAYLSGEVFFDNNFAASEWARLMPEGHIRVKNILFAPLIIGTKVMGLVVLANKPNGFDEQDALLAGAFGRLAAVALSDSQTLEALKGIEERFRSVAQTARDAIITGNRLGKIVFWNKAAEEIFGYQEAEAVGAPLTLIIPRRLQEAHTKGLDKLSRTGKQNLIGRTFETVGLRKDLSEFPLEMSLASWKTRGEVYYSGIIRDITKRREIEEKLNYRDRFQRLVTTISTRFINLSPLEIDSEIDNALRLIGEFACVDRSYIFLFNNNGAIMSNTHEWCAKGIKSELVNMRAVDVQELPWFTKGIKGLKNIQIPSVAKLPPEANREKRLFQQSGIQSLMAVPMVLGKSLVGFLGFDSVRSEKQWPHDVVALLKIVGEIFVNALERKRAEEVLYESELKFRSVFSQSPIGIALFNSEGRLIDFNQSFAKIFGVEGVEDFKGYYFMQDPAIPQELKNQITNGLAVDFEWECDFTNTKLFRTNKTGPHVLKIQATPLNVRSGSEYRFLVHVEDITERKRTDDRLKYLSLHDSLTGLYNRAYFEEKIKQTPEGKGIGVIICDIDGLKIVNDTLGHDAGDALIAAAGRLLQHSFRGNDVVARIGGDEFAVILTDVSREEVAQGCLRIKRAIEKYNLDPENRPISLSVGFDAGSPSSGKFIDLAKNADTNMYKEKMAKKKDKTNINIKTAQSN